MSNAVSALSGAAYEGYVTVSDQGPCGMVTLRADLSSGAVSKALKTVGLKVPAPLKISTAGGKSAGWMSPDELLILCVYEDADEVAAAISAAMAGAHCLVANVSDARTCLALKGPLVLEVLAKLTPTDISNLTAGDFRRSRLAQVAAAFWLEEAETFKIVCFRSVSQYVFDILKDASRPESAVN